MSVFFVSFWFYYPVLLLDFKGVVSLIFGCEDFVFMINFIEALKVKLKDGSFVEH